MPELPEVEAARKLAEIYIQGRQLQSVRTSNDPIVFDGITPRAFAHALRARKILAVRRKGKYLWMELDRRPWPLFHFGMTGSFHVYKRPVSRPRFWKMELITDDGFRLAMRNVRRLGRIRLTEDPERLPPVSNLGFDPLIEMLPIAAFVREVQKRSCPIKSLLLNQAFAAGVGNWLADETLYQARIDPHGRCNRLGADTIRNLRTCLRRIIRQAVAVDADASRFPSTWLFHVRWGRHASARTARGEVVRFDQIAGRTTAWVPSRQR